MLDYQNDRKDYTYTGSGFNGFMRRSIDSSTAATLPQAASEFRKSNNQSINFDHQQTTGNLGDTIQVGNTHIRSGIGISIYNEDKEVIRVGNRDA